MLGHCFKYTALGDSIAFGAGASKQYGYVNYLRDFLATQHSCVSLTNQAISGLKSTDLLLQLRQDTEIRVLVKHANLVTISIGGPTLSNFSLPPTWSINEVEIFTEDWIEILKEIRKSIQSKTTILVMTVYNPLQLGDPYYSALDRLIQQINQVIATPKYRSKYQYLVVDIYTDFQGKFTDGRRKICTWTHFCEASFDAHPTDIGHLEIARLHQLKYIRHLYANDLPLMI